MPIMIESYSETFEYSWKIYSQTLLKLRKVGENIGIRRDELYLPSSSGSKETAWNKWKLLLKEVIFADGKLNENILVNAIELYTKERYEEATRIRKVRMPMMSVFLNPTPKNDRDVEILDYIRQAKDLLDDTQRTIQHTQSSENRK